MSALGSALRGRTVWNVNSTARGGGVAELLASLIPYDRGAGIDEHWVVIEGSPEFFEVTKRIHNLLHGVSSDGAGFSAADRETYHSTFKRKAYSPPNLFKPPTTPTLHDPPTPALPQRPSAFPH